MTSTLIDVQFSATLTKSTAQMLIFTFEAKQLLSFSQPPAFGSERKVGNSFIQACVPLALDLAILLNLGSNKLPVTDKNAARRPSGSAGNAVIPEGRGQGCGSHASTRI